jgi:sulfur relay (sulfurtransferase) complex TusBCD TusD component (DsrE family)
MPDKLCKYAKKDKVEKKLEEYVELVNNPKVVCKKCGRAANKKGLVCKPHKFDEETTK